MWPKQRSGNCKLEGKMFTTTSVYFFMLFIIIWSYCGYLILLFIFSTLNPAESKKEHVADLPKIAMMVPCYNEEDYVRLKVDNLRELDYDRDKLEIYFIDGLSTDNTRKVITDLISDMPECHLIESEHKGKISQINYGLAKIGNDAEIIVSTDMDAILSNDVLIKFASEFNSDENIAVVGANISPQEAISVEKNYWQDHNLLRIIESNVYASSIVVAPCYAYKASLIDQFPRDCIADDIYVAFKANTEGYRTKYIESITGYEIRNPNTSSDFFKHKFRKGNAYLIELFRFFYRLPHMPGWWKVIYLTKLLQLAVIPWILPYFILSTISLALSGWGLFQIALFGFAFLSGSFLITSFMMERCRTEYLNITGPKKRYDVIPFIMSNLILIIVGLSYPFYRQTSSYQKIGGKGNS